MEIIVFLSIVIAVVAVLTSIVFPIAPLTPSVRTTVVGFLSLQGELHPQHRSENHYRDSKRLSPSHFSISMTLLLNTARPWFFLSVRKRLSVFSSTAMSIGLERCISMPASKLC